MRFMTPLTSLAMLLAAPVLSMPLEVRSPVAEQLSRELSSLTQSSAFLQIYTQNGGSLMNEGEYAARWASFNDAATTVANNLAGVPPLAAEDTEQVNGAFQTFSATHVSTLGQLQEVAGSKMTTDGKRNLSPAVSSNRERIGTISEYLSNKGLRQDRRFKDSRNDIDHAFEGAISALA